MLGAQRKSMQAAPLPGPQELVEGPTRLDNLDRIERHLPEIIGRALARSWIDDAFGDALLRDPKGLLARYGVTLPDNVALSVEGQGSERPRIVVSEIEADRCVRRLMYLQLVMIAGR